MSLSDDSKLEVLHQHYNNTFDTIKDALKRRDRSMLFIVLVLGLQFFQISDPKQASGAILNLLKSSYNIEIIVGKNIIDSILWFVLLVFIIRYNQSGVFLNRQYKYIYKIEDNLSSLMKENIITREGKSYLDNYPKFSDWIHFVFTWVFPILLTLVLTFNIVNSWEGIAAVFGAYGVSLTCYFMIVITIILYLRFCYKSNKNN